jgi:2-keto-4-pentenoate hydratase/2-oxohepta-3-ene-1,7-dioic acid hydratase in catechol pathway
LPPSADSFVDYVGEVAVIIGSVAHRVSANEAWSHVAGITAANDVTARDVQDGSNASVSGPNVGLAKSFDGFKPMGPALLSSDEVRDGRHLTVRTQVDGETRQASDTGQMEFPIAELVSRISHYMTLFPGDVILTGTPGGVGLADNRFLQAGQVVTVEVEVSEVVRELVEDGRLDLRVAHDGPTRRVGDVLRFDPERFRREVVEDRLEVALRNAGVDLLDRGEVGHRSSLSLMWCTE